MIKTKRKPTSPGIRHRTDRVFSPTLTTGEPLKGLVKGRRKAHAGRNASGKITMRHQGAGHKQLLRKVDFKRGKHGVPARVTQIEYDPNRRANLARVVYADGEKRYILAPVGLQGGDTVISGEDAEIKVGNALPLAKVPVGTPIHNLEIIPGKGGQLVRTAGVSAMIQSKDINEVTVVLP